MIKQLPTGRWLMDSGAKKPRVRQKFDTREQAAEALRKLRDDRRQFGATGQFTATQRGDILRAFGRLEHAGLQVGLYATVEFYIAHHKPKAGKVTLHELVERYLTDLKACPLHRSNVRRTLDAFACDFSKTAIPDLTPSLCQSWVANRKSAKDGSSPISELTRRHAKDHLAGMFRWAVHDGYSPSNPATFTVEVPGKSPYVLTLDESFSVLNAAWSLRKETQLWPYFILAMYCGFRREELLKMNVSAIYPNFTVLVEDYESKTGQFRHVPLPKCGQYLLGDQWTEWQEQALKDREALKQDPKSKPTPLIHRVNFRRNFRRVYTAAGFQSWPRNALRHSFASYFFATTQNSDELLRRLGHTTDAITFQHYLRPVREHHPEQYFALLPDGFTSGPFDWGPLFEKLLQNKGEL
jgi:integrase